MKRKKRSRYEIKTPEQFDKMREAGLVVARTLALLEDATKPGVTTLALDQLAKEHIYDNGATSNFLGYHGFPGVICTSINEQIVHGIPGDRVIEEGDLISIDCGAVVDGWHGDAAITVLVGEVPPEVAKLSEANREALWAGIRAVEAGVKLGDLGQVIEDTARAAGPYGIVEDYVGHGIGTAMHMDPNVPNIGFPGRGDELELGMAIAIEPQLTLGEYDTVMLDDDWTVVTSDGSIAAHWEHTIAITEDGPWVLTAEDGGAEILAS